MGYLGFALIILSPILGVFFSRIYTYLNSLLGLMAIDANFTSTSLVFVSIGIILILKNTDE